MLSQESLNEFSKARQRAFIEEWLSFFNGRPKDLLSFEEVRQNLRLRDSAYSGLQEIELDKIVGSVGRYRDFTRTFLPKNDTTQERWRRVDAVVHEEGAPPIDVYKVGDVYFVRDGNHRVSVARIHRAETIEAYVIEYKTAVPINAQDDLDDILLKTERAEFLAETQLDKVRPGHTVLFTEPGRYKLVKEHIAFHKYLKETDCNCEISYVEAVGSWYDTVYMPLIALIQQRNVLKHFPNRTQADLYAWLLLHRAELEKQTEALGYVPDQELINELELGATNPFTRLIGRFRQRLDLATLPLKVERAKFLEETQLDQIRPQHDLEFTEPGCYQIAREHIDVHKYLKETESSREISYEEAVGSWYDYVYLPIVQLIREREVLKYFPTNTEADFYIWLVSHRAIVEAEKGAMGQTPNEQILEDLEHEKLPGPITRLISFFHQKLDLQSVLNS